MSVVVLDALTQSRTASTIALSCAVRIVSGSKFVHPISYLVVAFASCYTLLSLVGVEMEGTNTAATSLSMLSLLGVCIAASCLVWFRKTWKCHQHSYQDHKLGNVSFS